MSYFYCATIVRQIICQLCTMLIIRKLTWYIHCLICNLNFGATPPQLKTLWSGKKHPQLRMMIKPVGWISWMTNLHPKNVHYLYIKHLWNGTFFIIKYFKLFKILICAYVLKILFICITFKIIVSIRCLLFIS